MVGRGQVRLEQKRNQALGVVVQMAAIPASGQHLSWRGCRRGAFRGASASVDNAFQAGVEIVLTVRYTVGVNGIVVRCNRIGCCGSGGGLRILCRKACGFDSGLGSFAYAQVKRLWDLRKLAGKQAGVGLTAKGETFCTE